MTTSQLKTVASQALGLMDLTSLNDDDTNANILALCEKASSEEGQVAAVCIYPQFIPVAREYFDSNGIENVQIATVTNFPQGGADIDQAVSETEQAVELGADEVDVVFPWRALINGDEQVGFDLVAACKKACGANTQLKVIIESGELKQAELIQKASEISIQAGADFIKTSTGKVPVNATLEAAEIMLKAITAHNPNCGFKAAGGIRTTQQAQDYMQLAQQICGTEWLTQAHFRFGASGLLDALKASIHGETLVSQSSY